VAQFLIAALDLPDDWRQQDAVGSYFEALAAIRERHLAGEPLRAPFVPRATMSETNDPQQPWTLRERLESIRDQLVAQLEQQTDRSAIAFLADVLIVLSALS
jgi:hypothetical protein